MTQQQEAVVSYETQIEQTIATYNTQASELVEEATITDLEEKVKALKAGGIQSQASLDVANELLVSIATERGKLNDFWSPITARFYSAHKMLVAARDAMLGRFDKMRGMVDPDVKAYLNRIEQQRREADRLAKEQEERERKAREEQERIQNQQFGSMSSMLDAMEDAPEMPAPKPLPPAPPPPRLGSGISVPGRFTFEVSSLEEFARAVLDGKIQGIKVEDVLEIKSAVVRKHVSAWGEKLNWPGITVVPDMSLNVRRRR